MTTVEARVPLDVPHLNINKAMPDRHLWEHLYDEAVEQFCKGSHSQPTLAKYYHVKAKRRQDEWLWLLPFVNNLELAEVNPPTHGAVAFVRRTKSGVAKFGQCGFFEWSRGEGPIYLWDFACDPAETVARHDLVFYPVDQKCQVWQSCSYDGNGKLVTRLFSLSVVGNVPDWEVKVSPLPRAMPISSTGTGEDFSFEQESVSDGWLKVTKAKGSGLEMQAAAVSSSSGSNSWFNC